MNAINNLVSLVDTSKREELTESILEALRLIHFDFNKQYKKVAIKTNLCYYWKSTTGETTDPKVIEAIIDIFKSYFATEEIYIVESDATVMKTNHAFKMLDYEKLSLKTGAKLINLCDEVLIPVENSRHKSDLHNLIKIPEILTKVDIFISVPKLKVHAITGLTCSLKNQFGCIPFQRKVVFHKDLHRIIAYINKLVTPNLVIVDGIIAKGKTTKKMNLIMVGNNPVSVDFVAAKIAGYNPKRIKHLMESEKLGVGSTKVKWVGEDPIKYTKIFPKRGFFYDIYSKSLFRLYSYYLSNFTAEGKIFKLQPAWGN
jgi:uncharacterized protein (DUF362 family)